jgi:hypothetical protein
MDAGAPPPSVPGRRWVAPVLVALPQVVSVLVGAAVMVIGLLVGLGLRDQCLWDRPCTGAAVWVRGYGMMHLLTVLLPVAGLAMTGTVLLVGRAVHRAVLGRWNAAVTPTLTGFAVALDVPVLLVSGLLLLVQPFASERLVPLTAGLVGLALVLVVYPVWGWRLTAERIGGSGREHLSVLTLGRADG